MVFHYKFSGKLNVLKLSRSLILWGVSNRTKLDTLFFLCFQLTICNNKYMEVEGFRILFRTIRDTLFLFDKSARNLTWRINGMKKININVCKKGCINRSCPPDVFCKKSCTEFFWKIQRKPPVP